MGWNAWTAISNVGDKIGVGLSTVATGYLKATELIPGVDYSDNETIQSIYTNSERMTDPISKVADPLVEWTVETGIPGAGEVLAYTATYVTSPIVVPAMIAAQETGLVDRDSEFVQNYNRRVDNIMGYGDYITSEPIDALGQAGQGLANAVTTTAGLVVDIGRGAINYSDDAIVGLYNLGIENPDEKADDWYHPLGDRDGKFFGVMDWAKEAGTFRPAISNKIKNENGELVDNPYAQYQRLTRYTFQGVGEVGAMVLTGGTIGAAWGAARGTKVVATTVRAGEEITEITAKATARVSQEAAEVAIKIADDVVEETAEATAKTTQATAKATTAATAETTTETTVKAAATSAERTTEATASMRGSANAANEVAEETVTLTVNGPSQTVTTNVANTLDDAAVEITDTAAKQTVVETSAKAANEAVEETVEATAKTTSEATGASAAQATDDVAQAAAEEMVRVRGIEGAQQGFVNGMKFMDPRASKGAAAAEVAGVTATIYLESKADQDAADNVTNKNNDAVDSFVDELEGDADMYNDDQTSHLPENISNQFPQSEPQSAMNTEFTNRANATQQPLESVNGKPIFTIALNQDDAVKFTSSLKV